MKVGLLNLRPKYETYDVPLSVPNGCDYLASYLNHNIENCNAFVEYDYQKLMLQKPDIIGISSFTRTYSDAIEISKRIKSTYPTIPIIIGGHHITAMPEDLDYNMDVGVIGEGEVTLYELVTTYIRDSIFNDDNLSTINGVIFKDKLGNFVKTKSRELIKNLDDLPLPYRTVIPEIRGFWQQVIFTSRGCPFRCKYCAISEFWESMRYHSHERIITELNLIISKEGNTNVIIYDDLFGINKKRLKLLVDSVRAEGIHKKLTFNCNARASVFDEEIAQMFVDMNIKNVVFGMESANDRILGYMKGATTAKQNQKALDICKKYNITAVPNFIVGFPTETKAEAADTYWFIKKNIKDLTDFRVFPACPLPGTHLWEYGIEKNLIDKNYKSWENLDFFFDTEKSIYLNPEQYDKYEYKKMVDDFMDLRIQSKPFIVTSGEGAEKHKYFTNIAKFIAKIELIKSNKVLEVASENFSINSFSNSVIATDSCKVINGKIELDYIKDIKYDTILVFNVLEKTINPKMEIEKLKNLLSENGQILVFSYNATNPLFIFKMLFTPDIYNSWDEKDKLMIFESINKLIFNEGNVSPEKIKEFTTHSNIYSFWGINSADNINLFTKVTLNELFEKSGFEVILNKSVNINLDKNIKYIYDTIKQIFSFYLKNEAGFDECFANIGLYKKV